MEATFGKLARGKKCESAVSKSQKIKGAQNIGELSERSVATETLSIRELACCLKFAG